MNDRKRILREWLSGFAGMLFIAVIGIVILLYGGVFATQRQIEEERARIAEAEAQWQRHQALIPVYSRILGREAQLLDQGTAMRVAQPLDQRALPGLPNELAGMAIANGLEQTGLDTRLLADDAGNRVRLDLRLSGGLPALEQYLRAMAGLPYWNGLHGFSVRAFGPAREIHLVMEVPLK